MSDDEVKHLMDFILKQQAIFSSDMIELKNRDRERSEDISRLAAIVEQLAAVVQQNAEEAEISRQEMRQALENLIVGNESTRELANRAAELAIHVSQRVTAHEQKPHK